MGISVFMGHEEGYTITSKSSIIGEKLAMKMQYFSYELDLRAMSSLFNKKAYTISWHTDQPRSILVQIKRT